MYYTYIHATPNGDVFYVGKGTGRRMYSMGDRSYEWREELNKHDGILIKVIKRFNTEAEAFTHEKELVVYYTKLGCKLVNKTDGGCGVIGYVVSEQRKINLSKKLTGYKHQKITCPVCGFVGGRTSTKRWHFDNCIGARPAHKIRTTILGKRIYLGKAFTQDGAKELAKEFYDLAMQEISLLNRQPFGA